MSRKPLYSYESQIKGTDNREGEWLCLNIEYHYTPARHATRFDPAEDEDVEIETVTLFGHDVSGWLDEVNFDFDALKQEIIENHTEDGD